MDELTALQQRQRSLETSVELDRQRHDLEQHDGREEPDRDQDEVQRAEQRTADQEEHPGARRNLERGRRPRTQRRLRLRRVTAPSSGPRCRSG